MAVRVWCVRVCGYKSVDVRVCGCKSVDVRVCGCKSVDVRVCDCKSVDVKVCDCKSVVCVGVGAHVDVGCGCGGVTSCVSKLVGTTKQFSAAHNFVNKNQDVFVLCIAFDLVPYSG